MKTKGIILFCLLSLSAVAVSAQKVQQNPVRERVDLTMSKIKVPLKLDASQLGRVDSAFTEYYKAQSQIFSEARSRGVLPDQAPFEKIKDQRDAKLKVVLTPGQYAKFKNEVEEMLRPQVKNHDGNQISFF